MRRSLDCVIILDGIVCGVVILCKEVSVILLITENGLDKITETPVHVTQYDSSSTQTAASETAIKLNQQLSKKQFSIKAEQYNRHYGRINCFRHHYF